MLKFSHIIEIDENNRKLTIFRMFEDGSKELYTFTVIPVGAKEDPSEFEAFAKMLGENILLDSPVGRKLFRLD